MNLVPVGCGHLVFESECAGEALVDGSGPFPEPEEKPSSTKLAGLLI